MYVCMYVERESAFYTTAGSGYMLTPCVPPSLLALSPFGRPYVCLCSGGAKALRAGQHILHRPRA